MDSRLRGNDKCETFFIEMALEAPQNSSHPSGGGQ